MFRRNCIVLYKFISSRLTVVSNEIALGKVTNISYRGKNYTNISRPIHTCSLCFDKKNDECIEKEGEKPSTWESEEKTEEIKQWEAYRKSGEPPPLEKGESEAERKVQDNQWGSHLFLKDDSVDSYSYGSSDRIRYRKLYRDPFHRTISILKDDIVEFLAGHFSLRRNPLVRVRTREEDSLIGRQFPDKREIFPDYCDIVIVGAGAIGASIAYHLEELGQQGGLRVVMVEKDMGYTNASTVLSVGGIRQQFSLPENIELSKYGFDFLRKSERLLAVPGQEPPSIGMEFHGYLTLATEEGMDVLRQNYSVQRKNKARVVLLSPGEIKQRYPWMNTDGIAGGILGTSREGWFDPWSYLLAVAKKAQNMGSEMVHGEVVGVNVVDTGDLLDKTPDIEVMQRVKSVSVKLPDGEVRDINCAVCVFAAGAWTGRLSRMAGIGVKGAQKSRATPVPIEPRKRYVYCIEAPDGPGINCPLLVDPSGTYIRREGLSDLYLCGRSPSPEEEPEDLSLDNVDTKYFEEKVWPVLAERCPGLERLKLKSSWAGYYDYNTFDQNGIVGYHPGFSNLIMASGFSGHGIQMSPGIGRAVKELIVNAEYETVNLHAFGFERFEDNKPLLERLIV